MMTKLTTAQQRAWELIKSELSLSDEEHRKYLSDRTFGKIYGKADEFALWNKKRITHKTMIALDNAGLIHITDMWMSRLYFRLTDAGKTEMAESATPPFCPTAGDLYARPGNEGIWALVITPERPDYGGYLVYAVLLYPNGHLSAPRMVVLLPSDNHICREFPLPVNGQLAFVRAEQMKAGAK